LADRNLTETRPPVEYKRVAFGDPGIGPWPTETVVIRVDP